MADNTELVAAKRCLRYHYFRHERHWRAEGKSLPLIFGGAWHAAMDIIWVEMATPGKQRSRQEIASRAYAAFLTVWTEEGMPEQLDYEMEKELAPRTPAQALEMIVAYITYRKLLGEDFEIISVEQPFAVPLEPDNPNLFYVGKIDKIVKRRGKILGIEHKTTTAYKKQGPFRSAFVDSFSPNSQVDGYLYALHMLFPDEVGGVWVDAALVHKLEEGFMFIPIEKRMEHLDAWLWEALWWVGLIEKNKEAAAKLDGSERYMQAFPKNTNSCWDFNQACPYMQICRAWPNPVGKETPPGFVEDRWSPVKHIKGLDAIIKE